ncbi:unnamed protein product, partial [Allacma fusca]
GNPLKSTSRFEKLKAGGWDTCETRMIYVCISGRN